MSMDASRPLSGVGAYVQDVWSLRHFWWSLVRIDLRNRYKRSVLGVGWSLLHPIAMTAVVCFCFHKIFHIELREYVPFLMTGMAFWTFVSATTTDSCWAFYHAQGFIKSERTPLAIYPLRVLLGTSLHFGITLSLALVITAMLQGFTHLAPLLSLLPSITLLMAFGWSVAVIMAFTAVHFPDITHLSTVGLQILFYLTPIMYPPSIVTSRGLEQVLLYNPLGYFVQLLRDPIMQSSFPDPRAYLITGALTLFMLLIAIWVLKRFERHLIFALV